MAARGTDHVWGIGDIVDLLDREGLGFLLPSSSLNRLLVDLMSS